MASNDPACMPCSRRSIDAALADPRITSRALRMRFAAVDKLLVMAEGTVKLFGPRDQVWASLNEANKQAQQLAQQQAAQQQQANAQSA